MQPLSLIPESPDSVKPWYAQCWPWLLMLGPVAVIIAGIITSWIAFTQQDALVVDDYYKQGKAINQDLRRDRAAATLGLISTLRYDPAGEKLTGVLLGHNAPVTGKIRLQLVHSTQPEKDIKLDAQTDSRGEFSIALPMLEKARWQVLIESEKRDWRLSGAWAWPLKQQITIKADLAPAD